MLINDLIKEKKELHQIRENHLKELFAWNNPSGILVCHKHSNWISWKKRDIENGHLITSSLRKTDIELAEKLAVNLYRIICIQYIQYRLNMIEQFIRNLHFSGSGDIEKEFCLSDQFSLSEKDYPAQLSVQNNKEKPYLADEWVVRGDFLTEGSFQKLFYRDRNCPRTPSEFFRNDSAYSQLICSYLSNKYANLLDWYNGPFKQNKDHPEGLQFPVKLGYKVRSKSEVLIADRLYEEGILFHYEELRPEFGDNNSPDCYIPIISPEKYAWEHFGAVDKENYFHRNRGKILEYLDRKWFPGINMITTYEIKGQPLSEEMVNHKISWLKSRYRSRLPDLPPDGSYNMYDLAAYVKCSKVGKC